MKIKTSNV